MNFFSEKAKNHGIMSLSYILIRLFDPPGLKRRIISIFRILILPEKKKRGGGRPMTKPPDNFSAVNKLLTSRGATDKQLSKYFGISEPTLNMWKKVYPQFFKSLQIGKQLADAEVEASLYQKALGYTYPEEKIFYDNKTGQVKKVLTFKHVPPSNAAIIFWLKNRQPEKWRDVYNHEGNPDKPIEINISTDELREMRKNVIEIDDC